MKVFIILSFVLASHQLLAESTASKSPEGCLPYIDNIISAKLKAEIYNSDKKARERAKNTPFATYTVEKKPVEVSDSMFRTASEDKKNQLESKKKVSFGDDVVLGPNREFEEVTVLKSSDVHVVGNKQYISEDYLENFKRKKALIREEFMSEGVFGPQKYRRISLANPVKDRLIRERIVDMLTKLSGSKYPVIYKRHTAFMVGKTKVSKAKVIEKFPKTLAAAMKKAEAEHKFSLDDEGVDPIKLLQNAKKIALAQVKDQDEAKGIIKAGFEWMENYFAIYKQLDDTFNHYTSLLRNQTELNIHGLREGFQGQGSASPDIDFLFVKKDGVEENVRTNFYDDSSSLSNFQGRYIDDPMTDLLNRKILGIGPRGEFEMKLIEHGFLREELEMMKREISFFLKNAESEGGPYTDSELAPLVLIRDKLKDHIQKDQWGAYDIAEESTIVVKKIEIIQELYEWLARGPIEMLGNVVGNGLEKFGSWAPLQQAGRKIQTNLDDKEVDKVIQDFTGDNIAQKRKYEQMKNRLGIRKAATNLSGVVSLYAGYSGVANGTEYILDGGPKDHLNQVVMFAGDIYDKYYGNRVACINAEVGDIKGYENLYDPAKIMKLKPDARLRNLDYEEDIIKVKEAAKIALQKDQVFRMCYFNYLMTRYGEGRGTIESFLMGDNLFTPETRDEEKFKQIYEDFKKTFVERYFYLAKKKMADKLEDDVAKVIERFYDMLSDDDNFIHPCAEKAENTADFGECVYGYLGSEDDFAPLDLNPKNFNTLDEFEQVINEAEKVTDQGKIDRKTLAILKKLYDQIKLDKSIMKGILETPERELQKAKPKKKKSARPVPKKSNTSATRG